MTDMKVKFIGETLDGQSRFPINKEELKKLGYRSALTTKPLGEELINCIAVPIAWTSLEARQAINEKFGEDSRRKPGKRSV